MALPFQTAFGQRDMTPQSAQLLPYGTNAYSVSEGMWPSNMLWYECVLSDWVSVFRLSPVI